MRILVLLAIAVALAGCPPRRVVRHGVVDEDALAPIRRDLPLARGLSFTAAVPARALDREEIATTVHTIIEESFAPGDVERTERVYARLGLMPRGADLRGGLQRLYEQEGAGFYDPHTKTLILAKSALGTGGMAVGLAGLLTGRDIIGEFLVAHELTHALQDQHWGIPTEPEDILDAHGDRELARHALFEGDATLAGFAYVARRQLDRDTIAMIQGRLRGLPAELAHKYPDAPALLRATLAFQYDDGTQFVGWALANGGWQAVDAIYADLPESTEQVLHPARYFATRDHPVAVTIGGTETLEAAGWHRIFEDTLGELPIHVLAATKFPEERAARVADGWGGDRLRALARGDDLTLVWMTAWDSPADATEFADALREIHPDATVEMRASRVLVLLGDARPDVATVWAKSR